MNKRGDWAVMFDLDETLVLTGALESLRRRRRWTEVYASLDQTRLPRGTLQFLRKVSQMAKLAVVTKAIGPYAKRLLAHHGINIPVVVAYYDVKRVKPDPEGLLLASQRLGVAPSRCIYVGDDENDVRAARSAGFAPIGVCWGTSMDIGLESVCTSWDQAYDEILRLIAG
jgi:HAD superfamily hydrolase (TIGR01549 family)